MHLGRKKKKEIPSEIRLNSFPKFLAELVYDNIPDKKAFPRNEAWKHFVIKLQEKGYAESWEEKPMEMMAHFSNLDSICKYKLLGWIKFGAESFVKESQMTEVLKYLSMIHLIFIMLEIDF